MTPVVAEFSQVTWEKAEGWRVIFEAVEVPKKANFCTRVTESKYMVTVWYGVNVVSGLDKIIFKEPTSVMYILMG